MRERTGTRGHIHTKIFKLFWFAPKRHTNYRIHRKSQIEIPKIVEIRAGCDERQGKNVQSPSRTCNILPILIFLNDIQNSPKEVTMKSCDAIYIVAS